MIHHRRVRVTATSRRNDPPETKRQFGTEMAAPVLNRGPQLAPERAALPRVRMEAGRIGEGKIKTFPKKETQGGAMWRLPLVGDGHCGQVEKERC
jgi:hypothetical protein